MASPAVTPAVALTTADPSRVEADLVVVPVFEGENPAAVVGGLEDSSAAAVTAAFSSRVIQGRPFELFLTPADGWRAARLAVVGCGNLKDFSTERLRKVATFA